MVKNNFSEEQKELIERLYKTDLDNNVPEVLVVIAGRDETKSREIENETGLRQPEVSIAMQEIREKGWVTKRDVKKKGKGRPVHAYSLDKPFKEIIEEIKEKERHKIEEIENNLERIKDLVSGLY